jgi:hypothetical protein
MRINPNTKKAQQASSICCAFLAYLAFYAEGGTREPTRLATNLNPASAV